MLQLQVLYRLLDDLRTEAIGMVESPADGDKNAFGYGRVSGMFFILNELRGRINATIEEADQKTEERG